MKNTLLERCTVNTNIDEDVFVGIQKVEGNYRVSFPLGFHRSEDEKLLRKDILLLMNTLSKHCDKKESEVSSNKKSGKETDFPIQAYLHVIKDFFERGYYKESEIIYHTAKKGKINWSRTIKTQKPIIQWNEVYYLDFIVKKNSINEDELITLVHKYCVYESFDKLGWLFTSFMPEKPQFKMKRKQMLLVVNSKLQNTFNDKNKQLFSCLKAILHNDIEDSDNNYKYGTHRFEYVWESMLDKTFGIKEKADFFPKTTWNFVDGTMQDNASLEPDTIMLSDDKIYVLDAKYYKYGWSKTPKHLPESTSINKQITYGEYIAENEKFKKNGKRPHVYNAFIMPFDSKGKAFPTEIPYRYIGTATSDWKQDNSDYEKVVGILMDVKYLMSLDGQSKQQEIELLSEMIEKAVEFMNV